jgi:hypothetical protein
MSKTYASRAVAGAVLSAALVAGSLSLAATVASAGKLPPAAAVTSGAAGARTAINCPPPSVSDPGSGGC